MWKWITIIHCIKRLKDKKTHDNIIRCKNTFENIRHSSNINTHNDLGIEEMYFKIKIYMTVQLLSHVWLFATPWTPAQEISPSITNSQSLIKLMSIESMMPSNHLILCHPLLLPHSVFTSITVFTKGSLLPIMWPKYWSFSFSISPSNEYSGLISIRMYWLDLFSVQGTLKRFIQHRSSKAPILQCSAFFIVQLSHLYVTTGKTIALTRQTFAINLYWNWNWMCFCV